VERDDKFAALVQLLSFTLALALSFVQGARNLEDVWYCQPLLWTASLLIGVSSQRFGLFEGGLVIENRVSFFAAMMLFLLVCLSAFQQLAPRLGEGARLKGSPLGRSWLGSQADPGALDEERGIPFISRAPGQGA